MEPAASAAGTDIHLTVKIENSVEHSDNPYQSHLSDNEARSGFRIRLGHIGLALSLLGVLGVCLAGPIFAFAWLAFLSVPGFLISLMGLVRPPRRVAAWGTALGLFGSLYVPTIYLAIRHHG